MTIKDFDDHSGPVEHLRTGGAFKIARLARRDLVIDDHEPRF
jgi:hypothetical protein